MLIDAHTHIIPGSDDITVLYNSVTADDWNRIPSSPQVIPFYGIHPWYAKSCSKNELMALGQLIQQKKEDALNQVQDGKRILFGIGETGLDKTGRNPDIEEQKGFFAFHLWLAQQYKVPVAVHCVHAWGPFMEILSEVPDDLPVIMHSFSGSMETAKALLKRNTFFSFSPDVRNVEKHLDVLRHLPLDRIFLETDLTQYPGDNLYHGFLKTFYGYVATVKRIQTPDFEKYLENNLKTLFPT